jgi:hypothetical protein
MRSFCKRKVVQPVLMLLVILTCNRPPTLEMVGEDPSLGGRAERAGICRSGEPGDVTRTLGLSR